MGGRGGNKIRREGERKKGGRGEGEGRRRKEKGGEGRRRGGEGSRREEGGGKNTIRELFTPSATVERNGGRMSEPLPLSSVWSICVCLCSVMASLKKVRRHTGWFSSSAVFILRRWISNEMSLEVGRVMSGEGGERRGLEERWGVGWEKGKGGD